MGPRMSPRLAPGLLSRGGAPQAAIHERDTGSSPCLRSWPKNGPTRICEAADGSSDRSPQVSSTGKAKGVFLIVRVCQLAGAKNTLHATIRLQTTLQSFA